MTRRLYKLNSANFHCGFFLRCIHFTIEEFDTHFVRRLNSFFDIGRMWHQCLFSCETEKDLHNKIHLEKANIQASYLSFSAYFAF